MFSVGAHGLLQYCFRKKEDLLNKNWKKQNCFIIFSFMPLPCTCFILAYHVSVEWMQPQQLMMMMMMMMMHFVCYFGLLDCVRWNDVEFRILG